MIEMDHEFDTDNLNDAGQDVDGFKAPDISAEEFAEHMANMFANALTATKLFEVVEVKAGVGQVHIMGRVKNDKERLFMERVGNAVLDVQLDHADICTVFLGKQMIRKELSLKSRTTKFAWVLSYASNDLRQATNLICRSFEQSVPKLEVMESPLMGPGSPQSGGRGTGRKGASPVM